MSVSSVFSCVECGGEAGRVTLYAPGEPVPTPEGDDIARLDSEIANRAAMRPRLHVVSGLGSVMFFEFGVAAVASALGGDDAMALHQLDVEYVPFWCPRCSAVYCADHWTRWEVFDEGFFDEVRGRCPRGHERMLLD